MATYAIGDVQGCFDELKALLRQINFKSDRDKLWFCGDLVNRGHKSLETLRFIESLENNAVSVLGNHDLHLLATAFNHKKPGRKDTFDELLQAKDSLKLLNWLRRQSMVHHDRKKNITLLHAGIHPNWSISKTLQLAAEVERVLRSGQHVKFYRNMYGDKPMQWNDALSGWARYRYVTNTLTRLRYCDKQGKAALNVKGAPGSQAKNLYPWYDVPGRVSRHDKIIFGHWSTLPHAGLSRVNNTYAIDSGCLWGGALTAMRIDVKPFEYFRLNCQAARKPAIKCKKSNGKKSSKKKGT